MRGKYPAGSAILLTIVPAADPWISELNAGVDGDVGVLHYSGEDHPEAPTAKAPRLPTPIR